MQLTKEKLIMTVTSYIICYVTCRMCTARSSAAGLQATRSPTDILTSKSLHCPVMFFCTDFWFFISTLEVIKNSRSLHLH